MTEDAPTPLIATPQAYPLICFADDEDPNDDKRYLVVGWTSDGAPVGVLQSESPTYRRLTFGPKVLSGRLAFLLGSMNTSVA